MRPPKIRIAHLLLVGVVAWPLVSAACTTEGVAIGEAESPAGEREGQVTLVWKSDFANPIGGTISGMLPDGTFYSGRYFEVTQTAEAEYYADAWVGWPSPYWSDWGYGGYYGDYYGGGWPTFVTLYSGRVIANLVSTDGQERLRCRFILAEPTEGLAGGGTGECQASDGRTLSDVVLAPE